MKTAVVFPGQGAQSLGMLKDFVEAHKLAREIYDCASSVLRYDVWRLTQEGPQETLNQTEYAQPVLLTASYAMWRVWREQHEKPNFLAGHSLGEYSALVCANALDFQDALRIVTDRGRFMQEAIPQGRGQMAAIIGLDDEKIKGICRDAAQGEVLSIANYNSFGQYVLAGEAKAIQRAVKLAKEHQAKLVKVLSVSVPSHCALMGPAAERMQMRLKDVTIYPPQIPVLHNVDVCAHTDAESIKDALVRQLVYPVRWVEIILQLKKDGVGGIFECGPGKVLTGLNKRIAPDLAVL